MQMQTKRMAPKGRENGAVTQVACESASGTVLSWIKLLGWCCLVKPWLLRAGTELRKVKPKLCGRNVLWDWAAPSLHAGQRWTRLRHGIQVLSKTMSTISCHSSHIWMWPVFGSLFKSNDEPVASELASIPHNRHARALAVRSIRIREVQINELLLYTQTRLYYDVKARGRACCFTVKSQVSASTTTLYLKWTFLKILCSCQAGDWHSSSSIFFPPQLWKYLPQHTAIQYSILVPCTNAVNTIWRYQSSLNAVLCSEEVPRQRDYPFVVKHFMTTSFFPARQCWRVF